MSRTHTHTVATLDVSHAAYDEIAARIRQSPGYEHCFLGDDTIDLTGIGLRRFDPSLTVGVRLPDKEDDGPTGDPRRRFGVVTGEGANARQVAGAHYGLSARQHWDIVTEFDLDYFQGQITKYVMRWDKKNGIVDLEKAAHFLEKYMEEIRAGRIAKDPSNIKSTD